MKIYLIIGLTFLAFISAIRLAAQTADGKNLQLPESWTEEQKSILTRQLAPFPKTTQVAFAKIEKGEVNYAGVLNDNWTLKSIDNKDRVFEIGSISKVFTSALLAKAILKGDVEKTTQISELIGYELLENAQINLLQLSNHTSGLMRMPSNFMFAQMKDADNPYIHYTEKELKSWLTTYMSKNLKQDVNSYSNLGAGLLSYGLSKKYDQTYEDMLQKQIFVPLEMTSTTTKIKNVKDLVVQGQNQKGLPTAHWEFDVLEGAGAVLSSVQDLEKFAQAVLKKDNEAFNLQTESTFVITEKMEIGMGWHIIKAKDGRDVLWHNGGTQGYTSSMLVDIENQNAIIILSNISAFHPNMGNIDNMAFQLLKKLSE